MTDLPKPPKTCSVYPCENPPSVPLRAQPPATKDNPSNMYWFCRACAPAYERSGYERVNVQAVLS